MQCRSTTSRLSSGHTLVTPQTWPRSLHTVVQAKADGATYFMSAGFSGDVGCAVSTVIAILGALGKECSEVHS